jgi:NAD(P)-dependent dehydrogenase (short-subunit alcohol dehydrogenase family)
MKTVKRAAIIISASSDIGSALSTRWSSNYWDVYGTYRTASPAAKALEGRGVKLVYCDLASADSIKKACTELRGLCPQWDALVICPGVLQPIGAFTAVDFDEWEESIKINFGSQMRLIHELLPTRRAQSAPEPIVILFAGGGTNSAPVNYSAYTVSKIGLIKMVELLDTEIPDTRFAIIGPGWVKTKIHDATLAAGKRAGSNYQSTVQRLAADDFIPINDVLDCCDWLVDAQRKIISGRNFSVAHDQWGTEALEEQLAANPDMYKLRRSGNDWR